MSREHRVKARRRATMRVGLAVIALMTAALTACIFDQGDYKGGGRKDNGGSSQSATATATDTSPTATTTTTAEDDAAGPDPFADAGDADGG